MHVKLTKPKGISVRKVKIDCKDHRQTLLVLSPEGGAKDAPGVLWIHGGGYITGMKEMVYWAILLLASPDWDSYCGSVPIE